MLFAASHLALSGLTELASPPDPQKLTAALQAEPSEDTAGWVQLATALAVVRADHIRFTRIEAGFKLAWAALILYAVAALMTQDPVVRTVGIAAGWFGLPLQLAQAAFGLFVARPQIVPYLPTIADTLQGAAHGPAADGNADAVLATLRAFTVLGPLLGFALGVGFCALLLASFSGRRGRALVTASLVARRHGHGG